MPRIIDDVTYAQVISILTTLPTVGGVVPPVVVPPPASNELVLPSNGSRAVSTDFGDQVLSLKFTTGANTGLGYVSLSEYGSGPAARVASLATSPGLVSLDGSAQPNILQTRSGVGITINFSVGPNTRRLPVLQANTTYYLNVRNWDMAGNQPSGGGAIGASVKLP